MKEVVVVGNVSAGSGLASHGIYESASVATTVSAPGIVAVAGSLIDSDQGDSAVVCRRFRAIQTLNTTRVHLNSTSGTTTFSSLDAVTAKVPVPSDVRLGVVYGNSEFVGTCSVPPAGSVASGVAVDAGTGTAVFSLSDFAQMTAAHVKASLDRQ